MAIKKIKIGSGTAVEINDSRIASSSPTDGQLLTYSSAAGGYVNKSPFVYGKSDTDAATVQKEVEVPGITSLNVGQVIIVQPGITSTAAASTLKLNTFEAYPMLYAGEAITTTTDRYVWNALFPSIFVFDGNYWVFLGHGIDVNNTYSAMSVSEGITGTATSLRTLRADYLKQIIQAHAPQSDWNAASGTAAEILNKPTVVSSITANGVTYSPTSGNVNLGNVGAGATPALSYSSLSNIAGNALIEFTETQRAYKRRIMLDTASVVNITLNTTNAFDNYVLIDNSVNSSDVNVLFAALQYNGTAVTTPIVPTNSITVPAGGFVEMSYYANAAIGVVTVSGKLTTNTA